MPETIFFSKSKYWLVALILPILVIVQFYVKIPAKEALIAMTRAHLTTQILVCTKPIQKDVEDKMGGWYWP